MYTRQMSDVRVCEAAPLCEDRMLKILEIISDDQKFTRALKKQACDVVDAMLAKGYIPDPDSIYSVCENGNIYLLTKLLQYPMDVQLGMVTAVQNKHLHLLDHLYLAGANVNLPDEDGNTLLHWTRTKICPWLLDMGARQVPNNRGQTPLHWACECKNNTLAKMLLSREDGIQSLCHLSSDNSSPLHWACRDSASTVELLLTYDQVVQSLSQVDDQGYTPLNWACYNGSLEIVQLLLMHEQGVQTISIANNKGNTPLHHVCMDHDITTVKLLLSHQQGVRCIDKCNNKGLTPLQIVCESNVELSNLLLSYSSP